MLKEQGKKTVVIYGVLGQLSEWVFEVAEKYKICVTIYVSDKIIQDKFMFHDYYVTNLNVIQKLNPDAIIICAKDSGKSIRTELDNLNLTKTDIYPAYDFSDSIWDKCFPVRVSVFKNN